MNLEFIAIFLFVTFLMDIALRVYQPKSFHRFVCSATILWIAVMIFVAMVGMINVNIDVEIDKATIKEVRLAE